jgi:hypothetical protein
MNKKIPLFFKGDRFIIYRVDYRRNNISYSIGATGTVTKGNATVNGRDTIIKVEFDPGCNINKNIYRCYNIPVDSRDALLIPEKHELHIGTEVIFTKHHTHAGIKKGTIGIVTGYHERGVYVKTDNDNSPVYVTLDYIRQRWYNKTRISVKKRKDGWYVIKSNKTRPTRIKMTKEKAIQFACLMAKDEENYIFVFDVKDGDQCRVLYSNGVQVERISIIASSKHMITDKIPA